MMSYKYFCIGRRANINPKGSRFMFLVTYNGSNLSDIETCIKKANIANIQVKQNDIPKRKQNTDFVRLVQGQNEYQYIFLNQGDLVAIKTYEIYVFNKDYVKQFFDVDMTNNIIKMKGEDK